MATLTVVLLGGALLATVIAMEAGVLRFPTLRLRRAARPDPIVEPDQCVATTAGGDRCVRGTADRRSHYCWQHQRMARQIGERSAQLASVGQ
ncbi:MAG TPA: hypothetical protein VHT25_05290 [Solirubrobacteraceae bacterium]|jgi:hypothetical protein|nr:hypothetical protein [Solirubrobacteraceae bacterium]